MKKIGGSVGSYLHSPAAAQYSHAYFAEGVGFFLQSFFATHPPLEERIRRIEPRWDGEYLQSGVKTSVASEPTPQQESQAEKLALTAAILTSAEQAISPDAVSEASVTRPDVSSRSSTIMVPVTCPSSS